MNVSRFLAGLLFAGAVVFQPASRLSAQEAAAPAPAPAPAAVPEGAAPSTVAQPPETPKKPEPTLKEIVAAKRAAVEALMPRPPVELVTDPEVVKLMSALPVQQSGRVKPLDTYARFLLLSMHGKQTIKAEKFDKETEKMVPIKDPVTGKPVLTGGGKSRFTAMEWLLVTWFRPDIAREFPVFVVDNSDAVALIGMQGRGKRDRYSVAEIGSDEGREKLSAKMAEVRGQDTDSLAPEYRAIVKLATDLLAYEVVLAHFNFARAPFGDEPDLVPREILPSLEPKDQEMASLLPRVGAYVQPWIADYVGNNPVVQTLQGNDRVRILLHMMSYFQRHPDANGVRSPWLRPFVQSVIAAWMGGTPDTVLSIFPPNKADEVWKSPGAIMQEAMFGAKVTAHEMEMLMAYQKLARSPGKPEDFKSSVKALVEMTTKAAEARGESGHIAMEISYHRADYFYYALIFFAFGALALGLSWTSPQGGWGRLCVKVCWGFMLVGAALGTVGIVIRCLIMERPPITTLYETIIFITTAAVIGALLVEWLSRKKGLGMTVACVAGAAGMFLSLRFFDMEAKDSLQQLQAVLITNFWLATHVPCINLGYAAGMVACICSLVYFTRRMFGVTKAGDEDARTITRIGYAFVLTGLFLSLVGTVLGGIWANYSWGRFWGWDPKENGALMIVLMNLIILHARLGGYIREAGFHASCVLLGMTTVFSWFATNQLGIGLHAYGELSGAWKWLYIIWGALAGYMLYGIVLARLDRGARAPTAASSGDASVREAQRRVDALRPGSVTKA